MRTLGILIQRLQKFVVSSTSLFSQRFQLHSLWQSPSQGQRALVLCNVALPHTFSLWPEGMLNRH